MLKRCRWVPFDKKEYVAYHDNEWGIPVHDDHKHFEMLILEGAQAGLSWYTILKRRNGYHKIFKGFDPQKVAAMTDSELETALKSSEIIRNRLKVFATRQNARIFIDLQKEFGSFDTYIWSFVGGQPIINFPEAPGDFRTHSSESDALSKDLQRRGMKFVGTTIIYAYMQAIGMVDDHEADCFKKKQK